MHDDTIAAIATPPGEGGVAMIRLSGPEARPIAEAIFRPARPGPLRPARLRYGHILHPDGAVLDEAMVAFLRAPHSFTREDVVEISCHGGPLPAQATLARCLAAGARLARPGEFTMRAFLNGRIDLSQAEATLDVIQAQTNAALAIAQSQLGGWLAGEVRAARAALLECLAYVTVVVDFPEDEVEPQDIGPQLRTGLHAAERLLAGADQGIIYRQGARVALVGRPNVGKSSLLNALLRADRAIVTPIPGTTRDTLEERANLAGIPVVLIDTAGIHDSPDPVEQLGIARSRAALAQADLALLVLDASQPLSADDRRIAELTVGRPTIVVWNKSDQAEGGGWRVAGGTLPLPPFQPPPTDSPEANENAAQPRHPPPAAATHLPPVTSAGLITEVRTSAATGAGIEQLAQAIAAALLGQAPAGTMARLVSNPRHQDALRRAVEHLRAAVAGWEQRHPTDLLGGDLTAALNALGEITGETVGDDLLDLIFSRFCIGK